MKSDKLLESTMKSLQVKLVETKTNKLTESDNNVNKQLIKDIVSKGDFSLDDIEYALYTKLNNKQARYILSNLNKFEDDHKLKDIEHILARTNDTKLCDFLINNKVDGTSLWEFELALYELEEGKITKEQYDFLVYNLINTSKEKIRSAVKGFKDGLTIEQVKEKLNNTQSMDKTFNKFNNSKLEEIVNMLEKEISLTYGWNIEDNEIEGTLDDDYSIFIKLLNNNEFEYDGKTYKDTKSVTQAVIKDCKNYIKSVMDAYGELPNYVKN